MTVLIGMGFMAFAAAQPAPNPAPELEEVLVVGQRPGPGLWRVSKDGHDLWILGTFEPLPKQMSWDSSGIERHLDMSQAVLAPPRVDPHIGVFRRLTLLPALFGARHYPDNRTLQQALPQELYARWQVLRARYLGTSTDEKLRPILAALDLFMHAVEQSGLTMDTGIWERVEKLSHKRRIPIEQVVLDIKIDNARDFVHDLQQIPMAAEISCLRTTVDHLETELPTLRETANAWSLGDVDRVRTLLKPDEPFACFDAFLSVPRFRAEFEQASKQLDGLWLARARAAIAGNATTTAVVPIEKLLSHDGWLTEFRELGYEVAEP
jgi:uncharacterized protein YbaP (TraB family)